MSLFGDLFFGALKVAGYVASFKEDINDSTNKSNSPKIISKNSVPTRAPQSNNTYTLDSEGLTQQPYTASIQTYYLNRYDNVFLEVSDLLWENNHNYIYSCKILNPSDILPMRDGNCIALHSDKFLSKKTQLMTSIKIAEKSKYEATYSLVNSNSDGPYYKKTSSVKGSVDDDFYYDDYTYTDPYDLYQHREDNPELYDEDGELEWWVDN